MKLKNLIGLKMQIKSSTLFIKNRFITQRMY